MPVSVLLQPPMNSAWFKIKHFQEPPLLQRVMLSSGALVVSFRESGFGGCCGNFHWPY